MKKVIVVFLSAMLLVSSFLVSACSGGKDPGTVTDGKVKLEISGLEQVYDGTAKTPEVKLVPADAGDLYVVLYRGDEKVSSAVDAGKYTVKISVKNTDEPFADTEREMVIAPKPLDLSAASLTPKEYDGGTGYAGQFTGLGGIVKGDEVTASVTGTFSDGAIGKDKPLGNVRAELTGKDAANYTVATGSLKADVVKKLLTVSGITVADKAADGTVTAEWTGTPVLNGVVRGEDVSIEITSMKFPSADSGSYDMALEYTLSGADAGKYDIAPKSGVVGKIVSSPDDFVFDRETGTVTGYLGSATSVVIPDSIDGVAVKKIGDRAFTTVAAEEGLSGGSEVDIEQITLPEGLEEIGAEAFVASALEEIAIPSGVRAIGARAFYYSSDLKTVTFGADVSEMTWGSGLFKNTAADNIVIPGAVTEIPDFCFESTTGTGTFVIPATVTAIGDSAFLRSKYAAFDFEAGTAPLTCEKQVFAGASMSSFELPARMVEMGGSFFQDAANLETFTFEEGRTQPLAAYCVAGAAQGFHLAGTVVKELNIPGEIGVVPNGLANNVSTLRSVTLGEGIREIGNFAFWGVSVTSVTFPKSLEKIGHSAFQGCAALETVTFAKGGTADLVIEPWSFQACGIKSPLEIPARTVHLGAACFAGNAISALTFEKGGTKPLVFADGIGDIAQGHGYQFDAIAATSVELPKRTVAFTLPSVFPAGCVVTYEQ